MTDKRWLSSGKTWEKLKPLARRMRKEPTEAESVLWQRLRGQGLNGVSFRRQHPLGRFIVDFYCPSARLVVEVDGEVHDSTAEADLGRQTLLEQQGFSVIRFSNSQVNANLDRVLEKIASHIVTIR